MTGQTFRRLALALPETEEGAHMGKADFRRNGKIFSTLGYPDADHGMILLAPEQQGVLIAAEPAVFSRANGAWGAKGSTLVRLQTARTASVTAALRLAWERALAPARTRKRTPAR